MMIQGHCQQVPDVAESLGLVLLAHLLGVEPLLAPVPQHLHLVQAEPADVEHLVRRGR